MYQLYWAKDSGAMVPQVLFEEIGAEYEKVVIDFEAGENRSAEFLAVNPTGQIPALALPDGTVMTESAAMVLQILDRHPDAKLAPPPASPERAVFLRWLIFMAANLYTTNLRFYYADRFTTDPEGVEGVTAAALADMDRAFSTLNEALDPGPYLLGETFSAVDIYLWMLVRWHPDPPKLSQANPRIARLMELLQERPTIASVGAEHDD